MAVREFMVDLGPELHGSHRTGSPRRGGTGVRQASAGAPRGRRHATRRPAARDARHEQPPRRRIRAGSLRRPGGRGEQEPPRGRAVVGWVRGPRPGSPLSCRGRRRRGRGRPGRLRGIGVHARPAGDQVPTPPSSRRSTLPWAARSPSTIPRQNLIGAFHQPRLVLIDPRRSGRFPSANTARASPRS